MPSSSGRGSRYERAAVVREEIAIAINNLLNARRRPDRGPAAPETRISRWPAIFALLALGLLVWWMPLPDRMRVGPPWLLLAVETPVMILLATVHHFELPVPPRAIRFAALTVLAVATALIAFSLFVLIADVVHEPLPGQARPPTPRGLLESAAGLWTSNVIVFTLWYWELDGGGPHHRHRPEPPPTDFLFPQQTGPGIGPPTWRPSFVDYLFVAFTNATAFSPTDTLPLTARVKALMMAQALISLLMVAIVAARAVNILQ